MCSSDDAGRMPGARTQSKLPNRDRRRKPTDVITRLYATPRPKLFGQASNRAPMSARAVVVIRPAPSSSLDSRSFTSCLAKGGQLHASGYRCAADKCLVDYCANGRDNQPFRSRRSATRPTSPEFLSLTKACPNSRDLDSVVVRPGSGDLVSTGAR
jgi:hypothetical protein